jgi:type IX secretion system PorP/SprF family membrane protein
VNKFLNILTKYRFLFILCLLTQSVYTQQLSLFDNYLFSNFYNINPAAAGFDGAFESTLSISKKWISLDQSPSSQVISNSLKLGDEGFYDNNMFLNRPLFNVAPRVGIGFSVFNESSGPLHHTGALMAYAYHIRLKEKHISFGISVLATQHYLNNSSFKPATLDDPVMNTRNSAFVPDFNLGVLCYSQRWFFGISVDRIVNINKTMDHTYTLPDIFVVGGYKYEMMTHVAFEPSLLFHSGGDLNNLIDLNFRLRYHDDYWLLLSYRSKREIISGIGLKIFDGIQMGYNYGFSSTGLSGYLRGSHSFAIYTDIAQLSQK